MKPTGKGTPMMLRLQPDMLAGVDRFASEHDVTRPEAVRMIVADWMDKHQVVNDLTKAINQHLDKAKAETEFVDTKAIAAALGQTFDHRTVDEIEDMVIAELRLRGLWATHEVEFITENGGS